MKRRSFIKGTALGGVGISSFSNIQGASKKTNINSEFYVTIDEQKVSFYSNIIKEKLKIVHIADTHLFMDDDRGIPFQDKITVTEWPRPTIKPHILKTERKQILMSALKILLHMQKKSMLI